MSICFIISHYTSTKKIFFSLNFTNENILIWPTTYHWYYCKNVPQIYSILQIFIIPKDRHARNLLTMHSVSISSHCFYNQGSGYKISGENGTILACDYWQNKPLVRRLITQNKAQSNFFHIEEFFQFWLENKNQISIW